MLGFVGCSLGIPFALCSAHPVALGVAAIGDPAWFIRGRALPIPEGTVRIDCHPGVEAQLVDGGFEVGSLGCLHRDCVLMVDTSTGRHGSLALSSVCTGAAMWKCGGEACTVPGEVVIELN